MIEWFDIIDLIVSFELPSTGLKDESRLEKIPIAAASIKAPSSRVEPTAPVEVKVWKQHTNFLRKRKGRRIAVIFAGNLVEDSDHVFRFCSKALMVWWRIGGIRLRQLSGLPLLDWVKKNCHKDTRGGCILFELRSKLKPSLGLMVA
ncbi:hypothetical protein STAS_29208 [Striga asiatica]|uniref:Uncharacterized protein n=1 Tax=Striga asiatica TaxID=4170 RepID=A0A5A7R237_STRAF|nr:hypothetical protein STAS_29208 [Striga asiatica]